MPLAAWCAIGAPETTLRGEIIALSILTGRLIIRAEIPVAP